MEREEEEEVGGGEDEEEEEAQGGEERCARQPMIYGGKKNVPSVADLDRGQAPSSGGAQRTRTVSTPQPRTYTHRPYPTTRTNDLVSYNT